LAVADIYTLPSNSALHRGVNDGILSNDSPVPSAPLRIVESSFPSHGSLTLGSEGQFDYVPNAGFVGIDRFTYRATDGQSTSAETEVLLRVGRYADLVLSQNPLAYWTFDDDSVLEIARDASGNEINGEFRGSAIELDEPGAIQAESSSSVRLGNDEATSINFGSPTSLLQLRNDLTIEAWVKPLSLQGHGRVLGTSTRDIQGGIGFGIFDAQLIFTTFGTKDYISSVVIPRTDDWFHVAAAFDSDDNATFYLNGENVGTVEGTSPASLGRGDVVLGSKSGHDETFNGWLDEVAIYNRVLSPTDFQMHYQMGIVHRGKVPVAVSDSLQMPYTAAPQVIVSEQELLANDHDSDSPDLSVELVGGALYGDLSISAGGQLTYHATHGFQATDSFSYAAFDGIQSSAPVTVELHFFRVIGDANEDGVFDSSDLIKVLQEGEYEDDIAGNSTFGDGDWNGDGEFDTSDLIYAFQFGRYV
jgi:hypothetical protein